MRRKALRRYHSLGTWIQVRSLPYFHNIQTPFRYKGWDWVPGEKLSLSISAWSKSSSSLVTAPELSDWLAKEGGAGADSKLPMEPQYPLVSSPGRGRGKGRLSCRGKGEPFLSTGCSLRAHISPESGGVLGQGLHNAGYFHPDVLCHHRPGHSVLHYLSALGTRNGGVEPADQGGRMKLTGRASCLLTHR